MICNLWHIKRTNGLYYYALDYLRAMKLSIHVLVRPEIFEAACQALPGHEVRSVSALGLVVELIGAAARGDWIFTPTHHPFPFIRRQIIVIHDDYPFHGFNGIVKHLVFKVALATSGCQVAYINHTSALRAIPLNLVRSRKVFFAPNPGPAAADVASLRDRYLATQSVKQNNLIRVALLGTDSRKKRYELLFEKICNRDLAERFSFAIYGHDTPYYQELKKAFPCLAMELTSSSEYSMEDFLGDISCIVSVAENEGFGRPIALALAAGIPCFMLQSPAFNEFFGRTTCMYYSIDALITELAQPSEYWPQHERFFELIDIQAAFSAAIIQIDTIVKMSCAK